MPLAAAPLVSLLKERKIEALVPEGRAHANHGHVKPLWPRTSDPRCGGCMGVIALDRPPRLVDLRLLPALHELVRTVHCSELPPSCSFPPSCSPCAVSFCIPRHDTKGCERRIRAWMIFLISFEFATLLRDHPRGGARAANQTKSTCLPFA